MREVSNHFDKPDQLLMALGTGVGATVALIVIERLSPEQAALVSALLIAVLAFAASELSKPRQWWLCVGMIAGVLVGLASVLSETIAENRQPLDFQIRILIVGVQASAGFVAGFIWGRKTPRATIPPLKTFLSRLGAITAGLYAVVVTLDFLWEGLEEARTLSSRLSVTTTIVITLLIIPGIAGYLLAERSKGTNAS